jgi:hypothetical protein
VLSFALLRAELYKSPCLRSQPALRMHLICTRARMVRAGGCESGPHRLFARRRHKMWQTLPALPACGGCVDHPIDLGQLLRPKQRPDQHGCHAYGAGSAAAQVVIRRTRVEPAGHRFSADANPSSPLHSHSCHSSPPLKLGCDRQDGCTRVVIRSRRRRWSEKDWVGA